MAFPPACAVDSPRATIELVAVVPKDSPAFALSLDKVHVVARPSAAPGAPVAVEVLGAIQFRGLADIDAYALKKTRSFAGGLLRAKRGARLVRTLPRGTALAGTLTFAGGALQVPDVVLSCTDLQVPSEPDTLPAPEEADASWMVGGDGDAPVDFWSLPGRKGKKLSVWAGTGFHRVETRGDSTLLALTLLDGTSLHGWVDTSQVSDGFAIAGLGLGGIGYGCGYSDSSLAGPAVVKAGTKVAAVPGGAPWGTVARATTMTVRLSPGKTHKDDIAEIQSVDGYIQDVGCATLQNAFIAPDSFDFVKPKKGP